MSVINVIDLGTNTAHILIATFVNGDLKPLQKKRHYTFLAENGIENISSSAQERLLKALDDFKQLEYSYNAEKTLIVGTEAFRLAKNGQQILDHISNNYNWNVEIISGEREAELIFKGVQQIVDIEIGNYLVMDIGGGSVEFIIASNNQIKWKESFPIGIANIFNEHLSSKALTHRDLKSISETLIKQLKPLALAINKFKDLTLIGAAGSFEVLTKNNSYKDDLKYKEVSRENFLALMREVINLSEEQRSEVAWIPKERVKYVTAAILLIRVAMNITSSKKIIISPYALKEGLAAEWFEKIHNHQNRFYF